MKRKQSVLVGILAMAMVFGFLAPALSFDYDEPVKKKPVETKGVKKVDYLVKDIDNYPKIAGGSEVSQYNYVISKSKIWIIEIIGILAIVGALFFGIGHGFGRFLATQKEGPVELELHGKEYVYNILMRIGHWINATLIVILIVTGFTMHYLGPRQDLGNLHNWAGNALVVVYIIFILYELLTLDYKQFVIRKWELREGILKQALFYAKGIFKQEEHPYHMSQETRLNPLQKPAYMGIMFLVLPVVVITGFVMANPTSSTGVLNYIGLENIDILFYAHLLAGFFVFAFLVGHVYLATTGETIWQHFEVMITGRHKHYKVKNGEKSAE